MLTTSISEFYNYKNEMEKLCSFIAVLYNRTTEFNNKYLRGGKATHKEWKFIEMEKIYDFIVRNSVYIRN
jgi:hypothetical protein